jgi:hypothetical protein
VKEVNEELKTTYIETARVLKGSERRMVMARIVKALGRGSQTWAERERGWCGDTIRKGQRELAEGPRTDNVGARGRKSAEERLPNLRDDLRANVEGQSQTDPTVQSARAVRQQLIEQKGYSNEQVPSEETIRVRINDQGYGLARGTPPSLRISIATKTTVVIGPFSRGGRSRLRSTPQTMTSSRRHL